MEKIASNGAEKSRRTVARVENSAIRRVRASAPVRRRRLGDEVAFHSECSRIDPSKRGCEPSRSLEILCLQNSHHFFLVAKFSGLNLISMSSFCDCHIIDILTCEVTVSNATWFEVPSKFMRDFGLKKIRNIKRLEF